jgi:hypothetical protein
MRRAICTLWDTASVYRTTRKATVETASQRAIHARGSGGGGDRRHPFGQRGQHRRGAAQRVTLQRFTSGEHQDDNRASQIFAQHDGRNDGNTAQQIGTKFPLQKLPKKVTQKRHPAENERGQQGNLVSGRCGVEAEAKHQMHKDGRDGKRRDDCRFAVQETGRRPFTQLAGPSPLGRWRAGVPKRYSLRGSSGRWLPGRPLSH